MFTAILCLNAKCWTQHLCASLGPGVIYAVKYYAASKKNPLAVWMFYLNIFKCEKSAL